MKTINNSDNYNKVLNDSLFNIYRSYLTLISEYLTFSTENIVIQKEIYLKYVLIRGIETLKNIFSILLLYTKNLELVNYHCQKSYYYYVEFIGQIGDDNHSFLQLNSKDATLFVYKKTIFEINNDFKTVFTSPTGSELKIINDTKMLISITNNIVNYFIQSSDSENIKEKKPIKQEINNIKKFMENLMKYESKKYFSNNLVTINKIIEYLIIKKFKYNKLISFLEIFIKRIYTSSYNNKKLENKINNIEFDNILLNSSNIKILNWIFSN